MAKEKTYSAIAKQFIKYNGEYLETGDKFKVKESDVEELSEYAHIEIPEETADQNPGQPGEGGGE